MHISVAVVLSSLPPARPLSRSCPVIEYVLMKRIFPRPQSTLFLREGRAFWSPSISELGIYGVYVGAGGDSTNPVLNEYAGYLLRTKVEGVDEGGVASGFSVLNSVFLTESSVK